MLSVCRVLLLFVCVFCLARCDVAAANKTDMQSVVSGVKEQLQQAQQLVQNATDEHKNKVLTGANDVLSLLNEANEITTQDKIKEKITKITKAEQKAEETKEAMEKTKTAVEKIKAAVGALKGMADAAAKKAGGAGGVVAAADTAFQLWENVTTKMESQLAAVDNVIGNTTAAKGKFEEKKREHESLSAPSSAAEPQSLGGGSEEPGGPRPIAPVPAPGTLPQVAAGPGAPGEAGEPQQSPDLQATKTEAAKPEAPPEESSGGPAAALLKPVSFAKPSLLSPLPTTTKLNVLQQTAFSSSGDGDSNDEGEAKADNEAKNALQSAIKGATELNATVHATNNVMLEAAKASAKAVKAAEKWAAALMSGDGKSTRGGGDAASLLSSLLFSPGSIPGVAFCFALYYLSVSVCAGGFYFELTVF